MLLSTPAQPTPRVRPVPADATNPLPQLAPVLDIRAQPCRLGRRAKQFVLLENDEFGEYKRACFEVSGVLVSLQFYRWTDDGTMTVFVDLAECVRRALPPLELAERALKGLGLDNVPCSWVHTPTQQLFWQRVDPHLVAARLEGKKVG